MSENITRDWLSAYKPQNAPNKFDVQNIKNREFLYGKLLLCVKIFIDMKNVMDKIFSLNNSKSRPFLREKVPPKFTRDV